MNDKSTDNQHQKLESLLNSNLELSKKNNDLLRKMKRNSTISLVLQISWYAILVGVPVILYWFLLEPFVSNNLINFDSIIELYGPKSQSE